MIEVLAYVASLGYLIAVLFYGVIFFKPVETPIIVSKYSGTILKATVFIQFIYIVMRSIYYKHAPITNIFELMALLAFGVTLTYIYIEFKTGVQETGFFILLASFIFQILASVFGKELMEINPVLRSWLLGVHVAAALIGYAAIIISGIYGFLYMMLYRNIKLNRTGNFYKKLPSLHLLEKLTENSIIFGFFFLTITILIGVIWLPMAIKEFSLIDPKLITTFIVWILYGMGFVSIRIMKMKSNATMRLALYGFIITIFSVLIVNLFTQSFHRFL